MIVYSIYFSFLFKIPFLNSSKCIFIWMKPNYTRSEESGEVQQLKHILKLLNNSMVRLYQFILLWFTGVGGLMTSTKPVFIAECDQMSSNYQETPKPSLQTRKLFDRVPEMLVCIYRILT